MQRTCLYTSVKISHPSHGSALFFFFEKLTLFPFCSCAVLCIVGNKVDLDDRRVISKRTGQEYAASIDAYFCETSALNNTGKT